MATDPATSPMLRTVTEHPTDYWNDSCAAAELEWAISRGATGATTNPTIVGEVVKKEWATWSKRIVDVRRERPQATDEEVTWQVIEELAIRGWKLLDPVFEQTSGRKGRLSIQTNPTFHVSAERMADQARHFHTLARNVQVKLPATAAGIAAIEEVTFAGVSINATVSFTVAQAIAVAEAVERGLRRREAAGLETASMTPVCTLMIGRTDDWVKAACHRDDIVVDPAAMDWAGIAVFKRACALYRERGYRTRPLAAAYRHHLHWSELIGGDVVLTIPYAWARRFDASAVEVRARFDDPVPQRHVDELLRHVPEFVKAYEPDGLAIADFDTYGATVRTLRAFISSYWDLVRTVDDLLLPNPDVQAKG